MFDAGAVPRRRWAQPRARETHRRAGAPSVWYVRAPDRAPVGSGPPGRLRRHCGVYMRGRTGTR
jgi:hypothetical protein